MTYTYTSTGLLCLFLVRLQTQACVLPSVREAVTAAPQEQQEQPAPWQRGHGRVLVRHWQDGSSFSREAAAMAAAAAAAANQQGAAAAALQEDHLEQQQHTHITEQQADLPGKTQQSPVAPGEGLSRFLLPLACSCACQPQPAACGQQLAVVLCHSTTPACSLLQVVELWCVTCSNHTSAACSRPCVHTSPWMQQRRTTAGCSRTDKACQPSEHIGGEGVQDDWGFAGCEG